MRQSTSKALLAEADRIIFALRQQVRRLEAAGLERAEEIAFAEARCNDLEEARLAAHERAAFWRELFMERSIEKRQEWLE